MYRYIYIYRAAIRTPSNFKMFQKHQKQLVLPSSDNLTCSTRPGRNWCNDDCVWLDEGRCVPGDEEVRYEDRCMDASTRGALLSELIISARPDLICT